MALELLSLLCTFENSTNVAKYRSIEILFQNKYFYEATIATIKSRLSTIFDRNLILQHFVEFSNA